MGAQERTPLYPAPAGAQRPLRVALVGPSQVPGWVLAFHGLIAGCDWVELTTLVAAGAALPKVSGIPASVRALLAFEQALLGGSRSLATVPMPCDARDDAGRTAAGPATTPAC